MQFVSSQCQEFNLLIVSCVTISSLAQNVFLFSSPFTIQRIYHRMFNALELVLPTNSALIDSEWRKINKNKPTSNEIRMDKLANHTWPFIPNSILPPIDYSIGKVKILQNSKHNRLARTRIGQANQSII